MLLPELDNQIFHHIRLHNLRFIRRFFRHTSGLLGDLELHHGSKQMADLLAVWAVKKLFGLSCSRVSTSVHGAQFLLPFTLGAQVYRPWYMLKQATLSAILQASLIHFSHAKLLQSVSIMRVIGFRRESRFVIHFLIRSV
jgi:hypothetical protein